MSKLTAFRVLLTCGEQADHIVPVSGGGGECDLSNYQTLCTGEYDPSNEKDSAKVLPLFKQSNCCSCRDTSGLLAVG